MTMTWPRMDRWEATPVVAVIGAVVLLIAGLLATLYNQGIYQGQKLNEVQVQAQVVAASVAGALAFEDSAASTQYLSALKRNPEVAAAAHTMSGGGSLRAIPARPGRCRPPTAPPPGSALRARHFVVVVPGDGRLDAAGIGLSADRRRDVRKKRPAVFGHRLLTLMRHCLSPCSPWPNRPCEGPISD